MGNKFGPCAVMAQVTRMTKDDAIKWQVIDGEFAGDGVRLWRWCRRVLCTCRWREGFGMVAVSRKG